MTDSAANNREWFPGAAVPERARFRLQHLFVLTAVMAVMLGVQGPQASFARELDDVPLVRMVSTGWGLVQSIVSAIAITVTGYGLYWRRQGYEFLHQPGHWLLLAATISGLVGVAWQLGFRMSRAAGFIDEAWPANSHSMSLLFTAMMFSIAIVGIGLNVYFARRQSERRWRWVFYLKAAAVIVQALADLFVVILMVHSIVGDRRENAPRDAVHWCGVTVQLVLSCLSVLFVPLMILYVVMGAR